MGNVLIDIVYDSEAGKVSSFKVNGNEIDLLHSGYMLSIVSPEITGTLRAFSQNFDSNNALHQNIAVAVKQMEHFITDFFHSILINNVSKILESLAHSEKRAEPVLLHHEEGTITNGVIESNVLPFKIVHSEGPIDEVSPQSEQNQAGIQPTSEKE